MNDAAQRFGEALARLESELDWSLLGDLYCHEGGEQFFLEEQVEALREAGLLVASALSERLRPQGRSLYIGAAVGELVLLLCESLVLGREVIAINLDNPESRELNRALAVVEVACGFALPRIEFVEISAVEGRFDHGWFVSVINDPEAFPALHDELYQRSGELATGRGDLADDRARASVLVEAWLQKLEADARVTTSDEELPVIAPLVRGRGSQLVLEERAILSAVVGDPIRFAVLQQRG